MTNRVRLPGQLEESCSVFRASKQEMGMTNCNCLNSKLKTPKLLSGQTESTVWTAAVGLHTSALSTSPIGPECIRPNTSTLRTNDTSVVTTCESTKLSWQQNEYLNLKSSANRRWSRLLLRFWFSTSQMQFFSWAPTNSTTQCVVYTLFSSML